MGNRLQKLKEEMSSIHLRPGSRNEKKADDEKANNGSEANAKPSINCTADPGQKQVGIYASMSVPEV